MERDGLPVDAGGDARACAAGSHMLGAMPWGRRFGPCMAVPESDAKSSKKVLFQNWNLKNSMKIGKDGAANP